MPQEMAASSVPDWTPGQKPCRTTGATVATRSAKAYAMLPAEEGSIVNYKLNCPSSDKPYAKGLLETDPGKLLTILPATEVAVFQRLRELAADQDAWGQFWDQVAPRCSAQSRSTQMGEHRVLQDPGQRRTVNS
jgi:hypothetical protein